MMKLLKIILSARVTAAFLSSGNSNLPFHINHFKSSTISPFFASPGSTVTSEGSSDDASAISGGEFSTLRLLEHINLNIPDHTYALPFYLDLLGLGLDPRRAGNVMKGSGTIWVNCGASQFHLPFGEEPQRLPGSIGLLYSSLEPLKNRLKKEIMRKKEKGEGCFLDSEVGVDERTGKEYVKLVDHYGNVFFAREKSDGMAIPGSSYGLRQPLVSTSDIDDFGEIASKYGKDDSECVGISYVEILVPPKSAAKIAEFYECALDATVSVLEVEDGLEIAIIAFGNIDENGRSDQTMLFREKDGYEIPPYDGHHVAMYVGLDAKDFEASFKNVDTAGVIWVNPRFSDKAVNLNGAKIYKQYRFRKILNLKDGKEIFELEHEMRSVQHDAWPGKKQN